MPKRFKSLKVIDPFLDMAAEIEEYYREDYTFYGLLDYKVTGERPIRIDKVKGIYIGDDQSL